MPDCSYAITSHVVHLQFRLCADKRALLNRIWGSEIGRCVATLVATLEPLSYGCSCACRRVCGARVCACGTPVLYVSFNQAAAGHAAEIAKCLEDTDPEVRNGAKDVLMKFPQATRHCSFARSDASREWMRTGVAVQRGWYVCF